MYMYALRKRLSVNAEYELFDGAGSPKSCATSPYSRRITAFLASAAALLAAGCASGDGAARADRNLGELGRQQLVLPAAPPLIDAQDDKDVERAMRLAERFSRRTLEQQRRTRTVEAVQTPLLYEAPAGRRFLAASGARALAIGDPPEICPAIGVAASESPAPRSQTAGTALTECLAMLKQSRASAECGCRLVALDDTLLAEQTAFTYARGVNAQFVGDKGEALSQPLIAEERPEDDGSGDVRIWFLDAIGPRAVARLSQAGDAELALLQGSNGELTATHYYRGRWTSEGFRRGRLAEKLYLKDEEGARMIALIGYSPAELAAREAELETWYD